ncbi:MAG: YdcF family protein, partial [Pyrinomonadaceae bacterium]
MRVKKILLIPVYLFIFLVAWAGLAWILANNLIIEKPLSKADALLVLSGSAAYIERTHEAAIIFKQGIAPKIFLTNDGLQSGWDQNEQRNPYFVERARWELIQQGIPEEAIEILPTIVSGTNDEANLLAQLANNRKLNSLLLVTSAYHSRRTFWTFERAMLRKNLDLQIGVVSSPT